jgi:hypothetical protein
VFALSASAPVFAQESAAKSAPLAKQLAAALDEKKIDSVAAKDPSHPGTYFAALYIPGLQLLVVANAYPAAQAMDGRLGRKEYRDAYIDLNSSGPATKVFFEDLGADGLKAKRDDPPFDSVERGSARTQFDGDWKKQKMSEDEYMKAFSAADDQYTQILTALLAQLKTGS